jgi:hypothetical protein
MPHRLVISQYGILSYYGISLASSPVVVAQPMHIDPTLRSFDTEVSSPGYRTLAGVKSRLKRTASHSALAEMSLVLM